MSKRTPEVLEILEKGLELFCILEAYLSKAGLSFLQLVVMATQKNRNQWNMWDYGLSWSFISACTTANSPLEVVRFRMQVMPLLVEQGHLNKLYQSCLNCAKRIYRYQGIKSFFKGNLSNLIRVVPSQTLVWALKEHCQRLFHYNQELTETQHLQYNTAIGIGASLAVSLSLYPFEVIRQLILNRTDKCMGMWDVISRTFEKNGATGFYKGAPIFSLGLILFRGTYFGVYDTLKVKTNDESTRWMASVLASYLSILAGYPIDTVRRRLVSCKGKYLNARQCFKDIINKEGIRGLFLGWQLITMQSLSLATIFYLYDRLMTDYDQAIN